MNFDRAYRIEEMASNDVTREHISCVHLDVEKKRMFATDGHGMVIVPCAPSALDRSGRMSVEAVKVARRTRGGATIRAGSKLLDVNGRVMFRRGKPVTPPPIDATVPKFRIGTEGSVTVTFNPRLLLRIARAMASESYVSLTFEPATKGDMIEPILVSPYRSSNKAMGVMMPARRF